MGRPGPETMAKRRREQKKAEKRRAKEEKMALRKAGKDNDEPTDVIQPVADTPSEEQSNSE